MRRELKDLQAVTVFGCTLCGALIGTIATSLFLLKLEVIANSGTRNHMSFESLASIMLGVTAIVVGVILPLAGIFAFGFLRSDVKHKTEEFMSNEIESGTFHKQVEEAINSALKDENGVLRRYVSESVAEAVDAKIAAFQIENRNAMSQFEVDRTLPANKKIEWGYEADEHGEPPRSKG